MPSTLSTFSEWLAGDNLPLHRATSRHLSAIRPQFAYTSPRNRHTGRRIYGLPLGQCGIKGNGQVFYYNPFTLYEEGVVTNLNSFVLGQIGQGKSSEVKFETYIAAHAGMNTMVTDLKGEYTALAGMLGGKVFRFNERADTFLNPLDPRMSPETRKNLVSNLAITAMSGERTSLSTMEDAILMEAITDLLRDVGDGVATLPNLVEKLGSPSEGMARDLRRTVEDIRTLGNDLFLGLRRLTETDLRGMFHHETTPGLFDETPLLVMNCEDLNDEKAVMMVTIINFLTYGMLETDGTQKFHRIIHDESWKLSEYPAFVASVRQAFKLGRSAGISNRMVMHHQQNLLRSSNQSAIQDLVADTGTFICFKQSRSEIEESAHFMNLTEAEVEMIVNLPRFTALWKIADLPAIPVRTGMYPELLPIVNSDRR